MGEDGDNRSVREPCGWAIPAITQDSGLVRTASRPPARVAEVMRSPVTTIQADQDLASTARLMAEERVSGLVVLKDQEVVGLVSERDFLRIVGQDEGVLYRLTVAEVMSCPVQTIDPDESLLEAGRLMEEGRIRRLPVVGPTGLVGMLSQGDVTRSLCEVDGEESVADIMSRQVVRISPDQSLVEASGLMHASRIACLVVCREGAAEGILTEKDVLRKVVALGRNPRDVRVQEVMSGPLVTIDPSYSVLSAARLMYQRHIHRLVVADQGAPCGLLSQTDIFRATRTRALRRARVLQEEQERSATPLFSLGPDAEMLYCNRAFAEFFGEADPAAFLHRPFLPDALWRNPCERAFFMEGLREGHVQFNELALQSHTGAPLYASALCIFHKDPEGTLSGIEGTLHDLTKLKLTEEILSQAVERAEEANRELKQMQSQLVQNEKLASIGQLAAGVAHEMNTPVGFVASNFETLGKFVDKLITLLEAYEGFAASVETSTPRPFQTALADLAQLRRQLKIDFVLQDIHGLFAESSEGLERVTSIVQTLRDFSRVDQARKHDVYDFNQSIRSTLIVARNELKHQAETLLELGDLPGVAYNVGEINQVLLNILVNAAQAIGAQENRRAEGIIRIKTYATEEEVICEISDNGPGMTAETQAKIFDPFFTTKPPGKGTGLGLSVSHDIITNKHKGQLLVESSPGKGTTFRIRLPRISQTGELPSTQLQET